MNSTEEREKIAIVTQDEQGRPRARVALAVFSLLFVFSTLFGSLVVLFADDLYVLARREAQNTDVERPGGPLERYRNQPDGPRAGELIRELGTAAFGRVDPEPYISSRLWRSIETTMKTRIGLLVLAVIGVVQTLRRRPSGRVILGFAFGGLIVLGAAEALIGQREGPLLVAEYQRDLGNAFRHETAAHGLSERFPDMLRTWESPGDGLVRRIAIAYFLLVTAIWQILLLALLGRRATIAPAGSETGS